MTAHQSTSVAVIRPSLTQDGYDWPTEHLEAPKLPALSQCRKCGGTMLPGRALAQTVECGDEGTCSPAGPGALIACMKCIKCGWSVTGLPESYWAAMKALGEEV